MDRVLQLKEQQNTGQTALHTMPRARHCRIDRRRRRCRAGFTLVEIMVALAVFMIMLSIILIPINLSLDMLHIGKARSEVQQASQVTLDQIQRELRLAVHVFPNAQLAGVTDRYPYGTTGNNQPPYFHLDGVTTINKAFIDSATTGVCTSGFGRRNNLSRIDFLVPRTDPDTGAVRTPTTPEFYLVTYYARRLLIPDSNDPPYDPFTNPMVLFRAQVPYRSLDPATRTSAPFPAPDRPTALNANIGVSRYFIPCVAGTEQNVNRGAMWITQSMHSEPNLEPLTRTGTAAGLIEGSHTLVTPRGMGLFVPEYRTGVYTPSTAFVCEDTNTDGKIDRVSISLELGQYDTAGADMRNGAPVDQRMRFPRVVDLPNAK